MSNGVSALLQPDQPEDKRASPPRRVHTATRRARWLFGVDAAVLTLAALAEALSAPAAGISDSVGSRVAFTLLVLGLMASRGAYRPATGHPYLDGLRMILSATALAAMLVTFVRLLSGNQPELAEAAIRSWLFAAVYLLAGRAVLAIAFQRANRRQLGAPTLIFGSGVVGHLVARRLLAHPEVGLRPVGFIDDQPLKAKTGSAPLPVLGAGRDLERIIDAHRVEHAIISFSTSSHQDQLRLSRTLSRMKISVSVVPRLFEGIPDRITLERAGGLPLMTIHPFNPRDWRISVKYALDRLLASVAIVLCSPLLLLGLLGTIATLGFPVIFRQRRVGRDGNEFDMLKFRTMPGTPEEDGEADAAWAAQILDESPSKEGPPPSGPAEKRRGSGFTRFMRRFGIDELPQLFNVLRGEMSMVGPRPERSSYVAMFRDKVRRYDDRHQVKAGITGWAQVHGLRGETSLHDRIEWDNYYIENWSPWLDMKILLLTFTALIRNPGE